MRNKSDLDFQFLSLFELFSGKIVSNEHLKDRTQQVVMLRKVDVNTLSSVLTTTRARPSVSFGFVSLVSFGFVC